MKPLPLKIYRKEINNDSTTCNERISLKIEEYN